MRRENHIGRKEALSKMGRYAVLTALGTYIVLTPNLAQSSSPPDPGGNPFD